MYLFAWHMISFLAFPRSPLRIPEEKLSFDQGRQVSVKIHDTFISCVLVNDPAIEGFLKDFLGGEER